MSLKGKTAIITGSTSGIGLGLARRLASAGINIMLNGFGDKDHIERHRRDLQSSGVKVLYHEADMTKPNEIERLIDYTLAQLGAVNILINNAGIQHVCPVDEFPPDMWDSILAVNLTSSFHTIRRSLPLMKKAGWGRIINIASVHGLVASPYKSAYVAAKHGIVGLTKSVALEVAEDNITVNAICPGYVKTPLVEKQIAKLSKVHGIRKQDVIKNKILKPHWTKQFVTVDQLAALTLLLCSDEACNITGCAQVIDGGWTAS